DFNTAIGLFQRNDHNINQAYLGNGMALLGLNRPDSALSNFQVVVRADPSNFEGHWGLGRAQLGTGRAEAALESFNAALALATEPAQTARVYFWRAQAFEALGQTAEQIADLSALAELDDLLAPTAQAQLTAIGPLPTATLSVTVTPTLAAVTLTPTRGTPARTPTATRTP
ncbi:MAG: tetratricopeptide repeat protein, partial [Anaerolineales bacterium]